MPSAREAAIERTADVLHWRGEGEKITWAEQQEQATPDTWGVVEFYREWAAEVVSALLAPSEERCTECQNGDRWIVNEFGSRMLGTCPVCSGSGKRSSAPLIVETLIEAGVLERVGCRDPDGSLWPLHVEPFDESEPLFRISHSSTSEENQ